MKISRFLFAPMIIFSILSIPDSWAYALDLTSSSNGLTVDTSQNSAKIDYSLPPAVTLGASDTVSWNVTNISTSDIEGNLSTDSLMDPYHGPLQFSLTPLGRRATLDFSSDFAGIFSVTVTAKVGSNSYSNTQKINFSVSPKRTQMSYSDGKSPSIEYESPDPGNDLQTVIRFKVNWKRTLNPMSMPEGPYWVQMWTVDSNGNLVRQPWESANPNTRIFWNDPQLNQTLSTGTDWINLPVNFKDWLGWGGVHVKVWWYMTDPQRGDHYIAFEKVFDIPIKFPSSKPFLNSNCGEVFSDKAGECDIQLVYKDALGNPAVGSPRNVTWNMLDGATLVASGSSNNVHANDSIKAIIPPGKNQVKLSASIVGSSINTESIASPHDYVADLINSVVLTKSCPSSFKGNSFKCTVALKADSKVQFKVPINFEERVDGLSWKSVKKAFITSNSSISVALPANNKKSLSFRASVAYLGKTFYSDIQDWITDAPSPTPRASTTPAPKLSTGDKAACSHYRSAMNQGAALPFGSSKLHYILAAGYQAAMSAATNPNLKLDFRIMLDASNGSGINSADAQIEIMDICG